MLKGNQAKWKGITALIIVLAAVLLIVYDVWVVLTHGVETTISRVLYYGAKDFPILAFAFGVLFGHLFWPQLISKDDPKCGHGGNSGQDSSVQEPAKKS